MQQLYFQIDGYNHSGCSNQCVLEKSQKCSFDSFYNACFIGSGGWPRSVGKLTCRLYLKGNFDISTFFCSKNGKKTLLEKRHYPNNTTEEYCEFLIPPLPELDGRIYPVLTALSEKCTIFGGEYICKNNPTKPVHLGLVICTYQREQELRHTLLEIVEDPALKDLLIFIVDNGRTLPRDQIPHNCRLLPNQNYGGSGGFSRGLLDLLDPKKCTHVILMDDDAQLDTETLFRTKKFFEYSPDRVLAGALLSLEYPCVANEVGADTHPHNPLQVVPKFNGLNLGISDGLCTWQQWSGAEYGGFWFFSFPLKIVHENGLILPFFLKADDIEFGLRITQKKFQIQIQAGVSVHHPDFMKFNLTKRYYWVRNMLIVRNLQNFSALTIIRGLFSEAIKEFFIGRSGFLLALHQGIEDFLEGPSWLGNVEDQCLISSLKSTWNKKPSLVYIWIKALFSIMKYSCYANKLKHQWKRSEMKYSSVEYWRHRLGL